MKMLHEHIRALTTQLKGFARKINVQVQIPKNASVPSLSTMTSEEKEKTTSSDSIDTTGEGSTSEAPLETDEGASVVASLGYDIATKTEDRGDGALTFVDMLRLSYSRWHKLEKDFFKKKSRLFDISKIPDIYDTAKHDVMHNHELLSLTPENLKTIFYLSRDLADVVVPSEYGIDAKQKVEIGGLVAGRLLSKIAADLIESLSLDAMKFGFPEASSLSTSPIPENHVVEDPKQQQRGRAPVSSGMIRSASVDLAGSVESEKRSQTSSVTSNDDHVASVDTSSATSSSTTTAASAVAQASHSVPPIKKREKETIHRLDKTQARLMGIKSSDRHVRTRLYFTSESHIHTLLNCLRFGGKVKNIKGLTKPEIPSPKWSAMQAIGEVPEISYLSHIVFRLFEVTEYTGAPKKFKARVLFSSGVDVNLVESVPKTSGSSSKQPKTTPPTVVVGNGGSDHSATGGQVASDHSFLKKPPLQALKTLPPASPLIPLWGEIDLESLVKLLESTVPESLLDKTFDIPVDPANEPLPAPAAAAVNLPESIGISLIPVGGISAEEDKNSEKRIASQFLSTFAPNAVAPLTTSFDVPSGDSTEGSTAAITPKKKKMILSFESDRHISVDTLSSDNNSSKGT
jgi:hypothetical protein